MLAPQKGEWSIPYSDESGSEYRVAYDAGAADFYGEPGVVTIEHVGTIDWPADKLEWLIERLIASRSAMSKSSYGEGKSDDP